MKARDIMSSPVFSVPPEAPVREVAGLLTRKRISAVPVLEGERLVGLVSEADVLHRRRLGGARQRAQDIMTREVETVSPDTPVEDVAVLLEERGIKRVPVLQAGRVIGMVSRSNLVQALAVKALPDTPPPFGDDAIRAQVLSRLEAMPGWHPGEANVVVHGGVVHLWGRVGADEAPEEARAAAARAPGVRRVEDHRTVAPGRAVAAAQGVQVRRASERGHSKHGWVEAYHSFSFGNFYDPAYNGYGPLRAINEKLVQAGQGSTTYGLSDIEVVTYLLEGELAYDDSLDNRRTLAAGGVQCLSAGSGVRFSEANTGASPSRFLQIWIEPDSVTQPAACAYAQFPPPARRGRLQAIVSGDARDGSLRLRQDAAVYAGLFDAAERAQVDARPGRLAYVHVARGEITVQGRALRAGDGLARAGAQIVLENGRDAEVLVLDLPEEAG
jgi:quercetin 2,3-dioxygenase